MNKTAILNVISDLQVDGEFTEANFEKLCKKVDGLGDVDEIVEILETEDEFHKSVLTEIGKKVGVGEEQAFNLLQKVFFAVGSEQLNREKGIQRRF